jgi:phytoene/squalene synthetase
MADGSRVDFDHCRELALIPGSFFEFTSRFLPTDKLQPLLALYALRQAISTIPCGLADDAVKMAKIMWWGEEIVADPASSSRHPVLRALWLSGARARLGNPLLLRLVSDAMSEIDGVPDSDEKAMFERLSALGATEIQLELALDGAEIDKQRLGFLGAATRSFRFISGFSANRVSGTGRLPLSLLAKYNVSAAQLAQGSHTAELSQIVAQLAECTLDWFSKGMSGLNIVPVASAGKHLQLRWALEKRSLNAIRQNTRGVLETSKNFGPADAWFAWRFMRKLK